MMEASEQESVAVDFFTGLSEAIGLETSVAATLTEDNVLQIDVDGSEVGLLIGPGLHTLDALQEIARHVVQREADDREYGKVQVDVAERGAHLRHQGGLAIGIGREIAELAAVQPLIHRGRAERRDIDEHEVQSKDCRQRETEGTGARPCGERDHGGQPELRGVACIEAEWQSER